MSSAVETRTGPTERPNPEVLRGASVGNFGKPCAKEPGWEGRGGAWRRLEASALHLVLLSYFSILKAAEQLAHLGVRLMAWRLRDQAWPHLVLAPWKQRQANLCVLGQPDLQSEFHNSHQ